MAYTARQLRGLAAMGLVAWRVRDPAAFRGVAGDASAPGPIGPPFAGPAPAGPPSAKAPPTEEPPAEEPPAEVPVEAPVEVPPPEVPPAGSTNVAPSIAPALGMPLPRAPGALAAWLPDQPLAPFVWKAQRLTRIGRDDAPLLVVVEREPAETLPLVGAAAELFERMLGAIGRTRRDTCQCVLAGVPVPGGDTVAALAGASRPATLVLVRELDRALDADGCRLPGDPFGGGAWCLPHPETLLAEPSVKRQAWLVLKAVRRHLPAPP